MTSRREDNPKILSLQNSKKAVMPKKVFILSGPSGAGKTSVLKEGFKYSEIEKNFLRVLTATTRPPRPGEKNGRDYLFLSKPEFSRLKRQDGFLETKNFLGNFYGTPKSFFQQAEAQGKFPLLCIDVEGASIIKKIYGRRTVLIFILPPSKKILSARLLRRRTEGEAVLKKRLRIAKKEVKYAEKYHYQIVNKNLQRAGEDLKEILLKEIAGENGICPD